MNEENDYLKHKEKLVIKDFETAFSVYQRLAAQVNSIRTWTVTMISASLALVLTNQSVQPISIATIALAALGAFLVLELRERSSMSFIRKEVTDLERLFMERDSKILQSKIADYEFRDLRLRQLTRREKVSHLFRSARNWTVVIWYGFWLTALALSLMVRLGAENLGVSIAAPG